MKRHIILIILKYNSEIYEGILKATIASRYVIKRLEAAYFKIMFANTCCKMRAKMLRAFSLEKKVSRAMNPAAMGHTHVHLHI